MPPRTQRASSARNEGAWACVCLSLSLGVACGFHVEAAPREASSWGLLRGSADAPPYHGAPLSTLGFEKFTIPQHQRAREFHVYMPKKVKTGNKKATGLLILFHGLGVSVDETCSGNDTSHYSFSAVPQADKHGFVAVCPQGVASDGICPGGCKYPGEDAGWNAEVCCGYPVEAKIDDVGFVRLMLEKLENQILKEKYPEKNVFAFGFSSGGLFSYRLACELPDKIHGVAPSGAAFNWGWWPDRGEDPKDKPMTWAENCRNKKTSIPVWNSLGAKDGGIPLEQGVKGFRQYAELLECKDPSCAATGAPKHGVECLTYSNCDGQAKARFCVYREVDHNVAKLRTNYDLGHVQEAWNFLADHKHTGGIHPVSMILHPLRTLAPLRNFFAPAPRHLIPGACAASAE